MRKLTRQERGALLGDLRELVDGLHTTTLANIATHYRITPSQLAAIRRKMGTFLTHRGGGRRPQRPPKIAKQKP